MVSNSPQFAESPGYGVPLEVVKYLLTLPDEVRQNFGNFLVDSTVAGFDGSPESSKQLWHEELERRLEAARNRPGPATSQEEALSRVVEAMEQLRRTPVPPNLHGYHCAEYFSDGWAERGYYCETSHYSVIQPVKDLHPEQRNGFFAIGGPGTDGIRFGYRYAHHGLWAFYPVEERFEFVAASVEELLDKWKAGGVIL